MTLFPRTETRPLSEQMRPASLDDWVGQSHLFNPGHFLSAIKSGGQTVLPNLILWGPPGVGKTTLAHLLATACDCEFETGSALHDPLATFRKVFEKGRILAQDGRRLLYFIDEVHRLNRAQQDAFLPHIEKGHITFIGATTENPSFALNSALLSRTTVLTLHPLDRSALMTLCNRALTMTRLSLTDDAAQALVEMAEGDGRWLINQIESLSHHKTANPGTENPGTSLPLSLVEMRQLLDKRPPHYDKGGDVHYHLISALHKSIRGSDPQAALYWFCRMVEGGEDMKYISRRLIRMASEEIGLAAPGALTQAVDALRAYEVLGSPEGELALAQAVVYLATAPKSNRVYSALKAAMACAKQSTSLMPPKHILNAPTTLMKQEGYGEGYLYDHDLPEGVSGQYYFPDDLKKPAAFYTPSTQGHESIVATRMENVLNIQKQRQKKT